jgi:hypothetical protein
MNEQQRTIIAEGLRKICQQLAPKYTHQAAPAILRNSAQCKSCGSHIESTHRRHFVACGCGSIAVDGGLDYIRRVGEPTLIADTSLFAPIG